jgi:site-specific recombinase XerD
MTQRPANLEAIFQAHLQTLALTLWPATMQGYRATVRRFLAFLRSRFPQLRRLSQLRRDPHLLAWFRSLAEQQPPLSTQTRLHHLVRLRRLLHDLAANGHPLLPQLIRAQDFPPPPHYLPRPLPLPDDQLLQQELRRTDDLAANALLLIRASGIRIGECVRLALDCLRQVGPEQWALHVPLGKLHTERLVPADPQLRHLVQRLLTLRALAPPSLLAKSQGFLLPRRGGRGALFATLRAALAQAAQRAGCSTPATPHQLRHTYATEMIRLGVSLPALMRLLGHQDIRMTLRYVQVTPQDLQREYHQARQNAAHPHRLPTLPLPQNLPTPDLPGIAQALAATRHLLHLYRQQLGDHQTRRQLQRLDKRLFAVASQLERINTDEK